MFNSQQSPRNVRRISSSPGHDSYRSGHHKRTTFSFNKPSPTKSKDETRNSEAVFVASQASNDVKKNSLPSDPNKDEVRQHTSSTVNGSFALAYRSKHKETDSKVILKSAKTSSRSKDEYIASSDAHDKIDKSQQSGKSAKPRKSVRFEIEKDENDTAVTSYSDQSSRHATNTPGISTHETKGKGKQSQLTCKSDREISKDVKQRSKASEIDKNDNEIDVARNTFTYKKKQEAKGKQKFIISSKTEELFAKNQKHRAKHRTHTLKKSELIDKWHNEQHCIYKVQPAAALNPTSPGRDPLSGGYPRSAYERQKHEQVLVDELMKAKRKQIDEKKQGPPLEKYKPGQSSKSSRENRGAMNALIEEGSTITEFAKLKDDEERKIKARLSSFDRANGKRSGKHSDEGPRFRA